MLLLKAVNLELTNINKRNTVHFQEKLLIWNEPYILFTTGVKTFHFAKFPPFMKKITAYYGFLEGEMIYFKRRDYPRRTGLKEDRQTLEVESQWFQTRCPRREITV